MRHACLILAHENWEQLKLLLQCLDAKNTDIYIHIDQKAKEVPFGELEQAVTKSGIQIYSEYKIYWGSYSVIEAELLLFRMAYSHHYDYYHLLSGADLPIKTKQEIDDFFAAHAGCEFVHFDTEERLKNDKELMARIRWYHFFQSYRTRFRSRLLNGFFTFLERGSYLLQWLCRVDRTKRHPEILMRYGSEWVSITDDLVGYLLRQRSLITDLFKYTKCTDEFFIQTLVFNSRFRERLYDPDFDNDLRGNMRLIDWERREDRAHPHTLRSGDFAEILRSPCLFARKFSLEEDPEIVRQVCEINNVLI